MTLRKTSLILLLALLAAAPLALAADEGAGKIPITTASVAAHDLYVQGRDAGERLRFNESRELFEKAVAADPSFALGHWQLANAATTAQGFFDEMKQAVALAGTASEGERHLILAQDAGVRGDVAGQRDHLTQLVAAFPNDERAQMALGGFHFGRQEFAAAVDCYRKVIAIDPKFSQSYNQLGYAERSLEHYADAEKAFKSYIELIPNDPNPYDSYAELLMKQGRYPESIDNYRKALAVDSHFVASYVGIANNQMFMGKGDEARATLAKLEASARNNGERRQAHFWEAASYVGEGDTAKALAALGKMAALADQDHDPAAKSGDVNLMGQVLLEAGKADDAQAKLTESARLLDGADVPAGVKEANQRANLYFEARVALAKGDAKGAAAKAGAYRTQAEAKKIPFEIRRIHELDGRIALAEKKFDLATAELAQANDQDPGVLYALAKAYEGAGEKDKAKATFAKATGFNGLNFNYAFIRHAARQNA